MTFEAIVVDPKTPNEVIDYEIDLVGLMASYWRPGEQVSSGDYRRPRIPTGFEYQAQDAGQTGNEEPAWPIAVAGTVVDGSLTWAAVEAAANAIDAISTVTASGDSDLTIGSPSPSGTLVTVRISGGVAGREYMVTLHVTLASGQEFDQDVLIRVRNQKANC